MTAATTPAPAYGPDPAFAVDENASPAAAGQAAPYATHPNPTKETIPMTDQTLANKVRPILDEWERIKEDAEWVDMDNLVQSVRALLPAPPRPTLADMTPEERAACQWMQCDVTGFQGQWVLATLCDDDDEAGLVAACGEICWSSPAQVTPRPDLPRMEWPGDQKPAPSLPGGWRLADHPGYGRVIVTNPTPDVGGHVYFVSPAPSPIGNDWHYCAPGELRYIDTEPEEA